MLDPELPTLERLSPWIRKMESNPGSCVCILIDHVPTQNFPRVCWTWLSEDERKAVRRSIKATNRKREASGEPSTSEALQ